MNKYRAILIGNGLANIPAKICSISSSPLKNDIGNGCHLCQGDIGHKNYCKSCGNYPEKDEIIKHLKLGKTDRLPISSETMAQLKNQDRQVQVLGSIQQDKLDGIVMGMTENVYYIFEDEKATVNKPLSILKYGIENTNTLLVVRTSITGTNKIGLIRSVTIQGKQVMLLQLVKYMEYAKEIDEKYTAVLSPEEQQMGIEYVKDQLKPIDLNEIKDPSVEIMQKILDGEQISIKQTEKKDELSFFSKPIEVKA